MTPERIHAKVCSLLTNCQPGTEIVDHRTQKEDPSKRGNEGTFKLKQTTASGGFLSALHRIQPRVCLWVMARARVATSVATVCILGRVPRAQASRTMSWQKSNETSSVQPFRELKQHYLFPRKVQEAQSSPVGYSFRRRPRIFHFFFSTLLFFSLFLLLSLRSLATFLDFSSSLERKGRGELWNLRLKATTFLADRWLLLGLKDYTILSRLPRMEYWLRSSVCEFCLCKL